MCTLILAWQVFPEMPVLAAANRDERHDRPSQPPAVRGGDRRIVAPTDERAGGTWIGYNEDGVFAAITNRWVDGSLAGERSRGLLVADALDRDTAERGARYVERAVAETEYEGFNLVIADAAAAIYLEWDGHLRVEPLEPGVHVVVNVGADGAFTLPDHRREIAREQATNAGRAHETLRAEPGESPESWLDRARAVLGDHSYGLCVHEDGFGTRSSSLVAIGSGGARFHHADGPPCETAFVPVSGSDIVADGQV